MLIAVLALLGVDLIVIVALLAFVLGRKRWVARQAGAFGGAIRISAGEIDGIGSTWRRGYGRWVRHVLVWTKSPFLFRNELVPSPPQRRRRRRPPGFSGLGRRPPGPRNTSPPADAAPIADRPSGEPSSARVLRSTETAPEPEAGG